MKPVHIILLLVAVLAGGLAAFLATRDSSPPPVQAVADAPATTHAEVLVAKAAIGVGQRLSPDALEWQVWPEDALRDEYITQAGAPDAPAQLENAVARFEFFPGEPIREQKLVRADQGYLSAVLPAGMRGVSISVNAESGAGGFIMPNDRVDVVLSQSGTTGENVSRTILSNVKVLAIGKRLGEMGTTGGEGGDSDPRSQMFDGTAIATLELAPPQAELVINAAASGQLALVLRSVADFAGAVSGGTGGQANQAVRMIRFGKSEQVMSGTASGPMVTTAPSSPVNATGLAAPLAMNPAASETGSAAQSSPGAMPAQVVTLQ